MTVAILHTDASTAFCRAMTSACKNGGRNRVGYARLAINRLLRIRTPLQFLNKDSISIRPQQREAFQHILSGRDTFINLPTGFGKSLIFDRSLEREECNKACSIARPLNAKRT